MKEFEIKDRYDLEDFRALIHFLRGPEGCPWDRVQTHESIRRNVLEEAYETAHAIDSGDVENLREELGDLLMQVLLHADMEEDAGHFNLDDVADAACKKLVFRHPHVFGTVSADNPDAVLVTWDEQKKAEKGQNSVTDTLVSVPENLHALWRAEKIQKKAAKVGFAWPEISDALKKLDEELDELHRGIAADDQDNTEEELGDVLFCTVTAALMKGVDPEMALHRSCEKMIRRFDCLERAITAQNKTPEELSFEEMEKLYREVKAREKT